MTYCLRFPLPCLPAVIDSTLKLGFSNASLNLCLLSAWSKPTRKITNTVGKRTCLGSCWRTSSCLYPWALWYTAGCLDDRDHDHAVKEIRDSCCSQLTQLDLVLLDCAWCFIGQGLQGHWMQDAQQLMLPARRTLIWALRWLLCTTLMAFPCAPLCFLTHGSQVPTATQEGKEGILMIRLSFLSTNLASF